MSRLKTCGKCGVPRMVSKGQVWHNNGTITERKDPSHRMLLTESENIDALFRGIEEIIGLPIEKLVIESKRRVTREYLEKMVPVIVRKAIYLVKPDFIAGRFTDIARAYGYGDVVLVEFRREFNDDDYVIMTVEEPYSVLFYRGDNLGGMEAATGRECSVDMKLIGDGKYNVDIRVASHPPELRERLKTRPNEYKKGDISFERCKSCGIPLDVAAYCWDLEAGTIITPRMGRRMALFGPFGLEAIFNDLEAELGETIPAAIIEAQRRYVRANLGPEWLKGPENFRRMCALRGMGNLTSFETDDRHITLTIENYCMDYMMAGTVQGLFEIAVGCDKSVPTIRHGDEHDLTVSVERS